jgi:hypothetical protein
VELDLSDKNMFKIVCFFFQKWKLKKQKNPQKSGKKRRKQIKMFPYHASPSIPNSIQDPPPIMQLIPVIQHRDYKVV